jgi:hypothetical protein
MIVKHLLWIGLMGLPTYHSLAQSGKFIIQNNSGVSRKEDPVVLTRDFLSGIFSIPENNKVLIVTDNGTELPSQLDDINGDGKWDELAFQLDIERNTKKEIRLKWVDAEKAPVYPKRTQAWFGLSENRDGKFKPVNFENRPDWWTPQQQPPRYQMEGPGWENDKVAFRNYFDSRNGMDIFGKTTTKMILDSVDGSYQDYHKMCPWGMDVLKVGASLGAGAFALIENGNLIPMQLTASASFRQIANGPVRSMIELSYEGWKAGAQFCNVRQRISIWAGKYWYRNEVLISGFSGEKELAIGIVNIKNPNPPMQINNNLAFNSLCTHARQSENGDMLGMALLFSNKIFSGYGEAPKIEPFPKKDTVSHTYFAKLKIRSGQAIDYQFFAGWEKSEAKFSNAKYFTDIVQEEADRREFPLLIQFK